MEDGDIIEAHLGQVRFFAFIETSLHERIICVHYSKVARAERSITEQYSTFNNCKNIAIHMRNSPDSVLLAFIVTLYFIPYHAVFYALASPA